MAYKKQVSGSGNSVDEIGANHNRIGQINIFSGAPGIIAICFCCSLILAMVGWMAWRYGGVLGILCIITVAGSFVSVWIIGICFVVVRVSCAIQQVQTNKILAQTIIAGEIVAYRNGGEWDHLSAIHEQSKVMPQLPMKAESKEPLPSEAYTVIDMHKQGVSFKKISEATLWTEYKVRQLCNQIDGKTP